MLVANAMSPLSVIGIGPDRLLLFNEKGAHFQLR